MNKKQIIGIIIFVVLVLSIIGIKAFTSKNGEESLTGLTTVISNIVLICYFHMGAEGMIISMALANFICSLYLFIRWN